jgi:hypothetical protein
LAQTTQGASVSTLNVDRVVDSSGGVLSPISSVHRNRIINGDFRIDQRNAGASVTPASGVTTYTVDRFGIFVNQSSKLTAQQNAGSVTPPVGFINYLGITSSSAYSVASGDVFTLVQSIEGLNVADFGWGTANASTVTLSFWVRSSLTGTFGGYITNSAQNRSYPYTYTISAANTWEQKSITVVGDTTGTWLRTNGIGVQVGFSLGVGSTYSGTASTWSGSTLYAPTGATSVVGTNGATFYITGVQLERGTQATSFEYRQYQQELALCQRYLPAFNSSNFQQNYFSGYCQSANTFLMTVPFKVSTRVPPTGLTAVGTASNFAVAFNGSGQNCTSAPTFVNSGTESGLTQWVVTSASIGMPGIAYQNATGLQLLFTGCEL